MKKYKSNAYIRKRILDNIYKKSSGEKAGLIFAGFLISIAIIFLISSAVYSIIKNAGIEGLIFVGAVLIFSLIPFFIGISLKNTIRYKCTLPYCNRVNESLAFNNDGFEFSYLKVKKNNSAVYYAIEYEEEDLDYDAMEHIIVEYKKINNYSYDNNILNLDGSFVMLVPYKDKKCFEEKYIDRFSIIMDFDDSEEIPERIGMRV